MRNNGRIVVPKHVAAKAQKAADKAVQRAFDQAVREKASMLDALAQAQGVTPGEYVLMQQVSVDGTAVRFWFQRKEEQGA